MKMLNFRYFAAKLSSEKVVSEIKLSSAIFASAGGF